MSLQTQYWKTWLISPKMLRILLIDDNSADRLLAIRILTSAFSDLHITEVGEPEAFNAALRESEFDLVITDYQLHWSNGLEILSIIQAGYPNCPVIMVTNSGSEEIAVQGMKEGLSDYVLKGKSLRRLPVAVQESLYKQQLRRDREETLRQLQRSEEELRQKAQELAEANQLKDEFLAILSHELRTPLNPILGWVQLLRRGHLDAEKVQYALEAIERNTRLQAQLIDDLLDISRILQGKLHLNYVPVDLVSTVESAIETVRIAAEAKQIRLETHLESTGRYVRGDSNRLQQIVWNILSNAFKFTPEGGKVEVYLTYSQDQAHLTIRDTGKGIESEFLPHVFEYFRQADSSTTRDSGGLGLGLAIVYHLTQLHGGTVRAESAGSGQGATFTVTLPLMQDVALANAGIPVNDKSPSLSNFRIVVVDDESDNLTLISFILKEAGAEVFATTSARDALASLPTFQPNLVISDIGMPEMDGYTLIHAIRSGSGPEAAVPAIALTAYAGEVNRRQILAAGFQSHLTKPIDLVELVAAIATMVPSSGADIERSDR